MNYELEHLNILLQCDGKVYFKNNVYHSFNITFLMDYWFVLSIF